MRKFNSRDHLNLVFTVIVVASSWAPLIAQANEVELGNLKNRIASIKNDTSAPRATIVGNTDFELSVEDLEKRNAELQRVEDSLLRNDSVSRATTQNDKIVSITRAADEDAEELVEIKELSAPKSNSSPRLKDEPKLVPLIQREEIATEDLKVIEKPIDPEALAAKAELRKKSQELASISKAKGESDTKLKDAHSKIADLLKELEETRNRLMIAETQVDRLARIVDQQSQSKAGQSGAATSKQTKASGASRPSAEPQSAGDMPVATVVVDKANLRAGPGPQHSVLMEVGKGSRLAVEDRLKDWYRVTTPTGTRAWVSSDVIAFGPDYQSSPTQTVKIRGFDASLEDKAFELIRNRTQ